MDQSHWELISLLVQTYIYLDMFITVIISYFNKLIYSLYWLNIMECRDHVNYCTTCCFVIVQQNILTNYTVSNSLIQQ